MKTLQTVATEMTAEIQARGELNRARGQMARPSRPRTPLAELETVSLFWLVPQYPWSADAMKAGVR